MGCINSHQGVLHALAAPLILPSWSTQVGDPFVQVHLLLLKPSACLSLHTTGSLMAVCSCWATRRTASLLQAASA